MKAPDTPSHTSPGADGWKDVIQLLKEQSKRMEKSARALSVIQQGMLRNNPGHVKDSVSEATEVLNGMLNTHKCLLKSGVEIQRRLIKDGFLLETALCVSVRYPKKADKGGEEGCSFSPQRSASQEREGRHTAIVRCGHQRPDTKKGWGMAAGGEEKKNEKREEEERGSCALCAGT